MSVEFQLELYGIPVGILLDVCWNSIGIIFEFELIVIVSLFDLCSMSSQIILEVWLTSIGLPLDGCWGSIVFLLKFCWFFVGFPLDRLKHKHRAPLKIRPPLKT